MNEDALIPVVPGSIGNIQQLTVDARKLHASLQVKRDFSNWIKGRISRYSFLEHIDFEVFAKTGENLEGGRPAIEYNLSLSMAKELSMLENNEAGRIARRYFIECEQELLKHLSAPALPPSRPQDARATYADMKHLRDLVRQWENVTGRMRRTIVRQYEAWLKTPTSRFTLDDVDNAMLFVQARLDAIASEEAARRSAAKELPPAREKEETPAPVSVPGIQEDFLVFQREAGRLITGAYELVLAASEYRRAMKKDGHSELDPAVTEKLTSACMAQATCMGQNIESLSRMLAILI